MPELPEVETIKRELAERIAGKTIVRVQIFKPLVVRQPQASFKRLLQGKRIRTVLRKGKLLLIEFAGGTALSVHLKMTGQLVYPGGGTVCRVRFHFNDGTCLDYRDQRMFGELRVVDDWRALAFVTSLGPEPFDLAPQQFFRMLTGRTTRIKPLLLDQHFIAGIGNLYAAEALFRARIHPGRRASSLSQQEARTLLREIKRTLAAAITHKGSSLDQYVRSDGSKGGYVQFHRVYGRDGKPCLKCRGTILRIAIAGRGTYFCPACQKEA